MQATSLWTTSLEMQIHIYNPDRVAFTHEVETYPSWVWLALEKGRFWFRLGTGRAATEGECGAGDWVLCPPHEPLQRRMLSPCNFHHARFSAPGEAFYALRGHGTLRNSRLLHANMTAMQERKELPYLLEWKGHLLLDILRRAAWEKQHQALAQQGDAAMRQIRETLEAKFNEKISLAELAAGTRLSPGTFSKRFNAAYGIPPQEFLLRQRLNHTRTLLLTTDLTIDAIARQSGFSNGFYLSRLWTKRTGVSPARFRQTHRV